MSDIDELRIRLEQRDVTVEEVWRYLVLQHQPTGGMVMQDTAKFISDADIPHFWALYDWWEPVKEKPTTLPTPRIAQFCWYVNHAEGAPALSFMQAMMQFYNRAHAHCVSNGLDVASPGETAAQRRKRINRERMASVRVHRRVPDKVLGDDPVLASQVRELESECEAIKANAKLLDSAHAAAVKEHYEAMMVASTRRKEVAAEHKERIEELRTKIRTLTAKQ